MPEIKLVLVTGAGASHGMSLLPDEPLPLMTDWANRLKTTIGKGLSDMTGLSDAKDGVEFEETLGALFRWLDTLDDAERFRLMARKQPNDDTLPNQLHQALQHARRNARDFQERLHASLFDEFGPERVDADVAAAAYRSLFELIDVPLDARGLPKALVCATTNYDRSLEMALDELGADTRSGFIAQRFRSTVLEPMGLGSFQDEPAVLYLHGAVGWYRMDDGSITSMPADRGYNASLGTPAVLYPGPDKDVNRSETVELWREFREALAEATHVLVLGHALNDTHLVDALRHRGPRVAVTYYEPPPEIISGSELHRIKRERDAIVRKLADATPIAVDFGRDVRIDEDAVMRWRG